MRLDQLAKADVGHLIEAYRDAASEHGMASARGEHKVANKAASLVGAIYSELRRRGPDAQRALLPLLGDPAPGVRLWSASHTLEFSRAEAEACLKLLISS